MVVSINQRFLLFAFLSFSIFPLLPVKILGLPVVLFFSASIVNYYYLPNKNLNYIKLFILLIPYFLFLISVFYSQNFSNALNKITETRLSLLLIPLSFFILDKTSLKHLKYNLRRFQIIFCISTAVLCLVYFFYLPFVTAPINSHFAFPSGFFFKTAAINMPYWKLEPVYFSFIVVLAYISVVNLYQKQQFKAKYSLVLSIIYFLVLIFMVSKIALIFSFVFSIWLVCIKVKKIKHISIIVFILAISLYPIFQIPSVKYEIEEIQYFLKDELRVKNDTNDIRYRITVSALELANQVHPIIGTGIGDTQHDLNKIYLEKGYKDLLQKKHDTHNQYLSIFIGVGLLGLLGLLFQLGLLGFHFFKKRLIFAVWVLSFFMLQMLTETVLERQISVITYAFFTSMIMFSRH